MVTHCGVRARYKRSLLHYTYPLMCLVGRPADRPVRPPACPTDEQLSSLQCFLPPLLRSPLLAVVASTVTPAPASFYRHRRRTPERLPLGELHSDMRSPNRD